MGRLSKQEDAWQAEATAKAIAAARSIAQGRAANTLVGRLADPQWGWIITAAIFSWIETRHRQAIAEGLAPEEHVTRMDPSPRDGALALSILPKLADQCVIDWTKPLMDWSRDEMAGFVELASGLIDEARAALDRKGNVILRKTEGAPFNDAIPF